MQAKKEIRAGRLYIGSIYPLGFLPKQRPSQRSKRKKVQTEAKRLINFIERKYYLMQLFGVNFKPNRDLFIELSFAKEPTEKEEKRALERFHRRMNNFFKKKGKQYRYILVRETHNRDGQPVRQHYHIVCTGTGQLMQEKIIQFWGMGGVNVQSLRELSDNFEDTCEYLLKEKKPENERSYRCSRNLKRPEEPLRRKIPESECGQVPPGVEDIKFYRDNNDFGRYEIIIGKIVDEKAFDLYWQKAKMDKRRCDEAANWRRYAKEKRKKVKYCKI